ncbi:MAG: cytochrome c [Mesorhizobium sp.]|uniref:c-type cytochrome n=1 Tax=Mesorhizobium sp. TaxID=1871066 RepID=UPI0011FE531A|nr:cytochrome c [Mesorhizobium sp.]TIP23014.1 MAG: cytochrome c [Mesorhizobium sp.]
MLVAGAALAHKGATGIVAERMSVMKRMAENMKAIGEMLDGRREFDANAARATAEALHANCHKAREQFPSGTRDHHSRASPAIWENPDRFEAEMQHFDTAVKALVAASGPGDIDNMRAPFRNVGQACSSCHEGFRLPK